MIDAREHLGLVLHIARQIYPMDGTEADDVIGAGYIGLVHAASRFDPSAGVTFPSYASPRIRGAMQDHLRALYGRQGRERRVGPPRDPVRAAESQEDAILSRVDAERALLRVTGRERWVLIELFYRDREGKEVALDLGITESMVSRIKSSALRKIRAGLL